MAKSELKDMSKEPESIAKRLEKLTEDAKAKEVTPKTITTTLGELVGAVPSLNKLLTRDLPTKVAYHLAKLGRLVREEVKFYEEQKDKWIKEYGEERPPTKAEERAGLTGTVTAVKTEHFEVFKTKMEELGKQDVTLAWGPITSDQVGENISGADILALGALMVEGE